MAQTFQIHNTLRSPNFDDRTTNINIIVIHSTHLSFKDSIERLCDKTSKVSCHYIIDLNGKTYQLVDDAKRAWHAGKSYWKGKSGLNNNSIGIELVDTNPKGTRIKKFPKKQMESLVQLLKTLIKKYKISNKNIVAHSDIAPDRKDDPGEHFDWKLLANQKICIFHSINTSKESNLPIKLNQTQTKDLQRSLKRIGYKINITGKFDQQTQEVITAFRRRFNPKYLTAKSWSVLDNKVLMSLVRSI